MPKKKQEEETETEPTSLEAALAAVDKQFGSGTLLKASSEALPGVEFISSGSITLDRALGGGWAKGRVVEIYGRESTGKTTLALHAIAEAQKKALTAAFIDAEHSLDIPYTSRLGVDIDKLYICQPDDGEQALEVVDKLARTGAVGIVVVDSVAALIPRAELEGEMGDSRPGAQARLMSQALRKLVGVVRQSNTLLMFINQLRMKIGVMYGNPETTTGGEALKFYTAQRVDLRRTEFIKNGDIILGIGVRAKVVKNKVAAPFRETVFQLRYGEGIDRAGEVLSLAVEQGIVEKAGAWYSYNEGKIGQGEAAARQYLIENSEALAEVEGKLENG